MAFVFHLGNCELNCTLSHLTDYKTSLILKYPVIVIFTDKRAPEWFLPCVRIYYYTLNFSYVIIINVYRKA